MGPGPAAAIEASDITLVSGDLRAAADAIRLSRRTLKTIRSNLFWAFAHNVAALPLGRARLLHPLPAPPPRRRQAHPVLGVRLQRRRAPARRRRLPQPVARRRGDGVLERLR